MEVALWEHWIQGNVSKLYSLNPCYNGSSSLREPRKHHHRMGKDVLILVIMEVALWDIERTYEEISHEGLNPCYNGSSSLSCIRGQFIDVYERS